MTSVIKRKIGLFGGTFDPVHLGHLRLALEAAESLGLEQVRLLPCHQPPHRNSPQVESWQRAEMLQLAMGASPLLRVDERELGRQGPSYTLETLQSLRAELGLEVSLVWIMGSDAFVHLETWHRWRELLDWAHLLVVLRPGCAMPDQGPLWDWWQAHRAERVGVLDESPAGSLLVRELRLLPISATEIRALVQAGQSPAYLVPERVGRYLQQHQLYFEASLDSSDSSELMNDTGGKCPQR